MTSEKLSKPALFIAGFGLFMFTRRSELLPTIQIFIIIAPIFILRFTRLLPAKKGIILNLIGFVLSMNISLWGIYAINSTADIIFSIVRSTLLAILYFLPYMIDRLIYPKTSGNRIISSLFFPVSVTAIMFLSSLEGPFDGTVAKTIYSYGSPAIQQLNSLTGLWGFIFIYSWIASVINSFREDRFKWEKIKKTAFIFISVLVIIPLFGVVRLSLNEKNNKEKVKTALIIILPENGEAVQMTEVLKSKTLSPFRETIEKVSGLTEQAAENQAKIIAFQEFLILIQKEDETKLKSEFMKIARENNIYLSVSYAYFSESEKGENKNLLIDDKGNIIIDYTKRYLLGIGAIGETAAFVKGEEIIQTADTPYGRLAVSICRDMNFPSYIRQAAKQDVDIMINPSYDYPKSLEPGYYQRAIEFGFSTLRPTYNGISYAEDYKGRLLARMDSDETGTGILYAEVPTRGLRTLYGIIGDAVGWICVVLMIILIIPVFRNLIVRNR